MSTMKFLRDHSEWLGKQWAMSPEGREYKAKFDAAVSQAAEALGSLEELAELYARHVKHSHELVAHMRACKAVEAMKEADET